MKPTIRKEQTEDTENAEAVTTTAPPATNALTDEKKHKVKKSILRAAAVSLPLSYHFCVLNLVVIMCHFFGHFLENERRRLGASARYT